MEDTKKQDLVLERIEKLFELAKKNIKKYPERSNRYAEMIRKLAMRHNVRLPKDIRRGICKKCHKFLVPGENSRIRTNKRQQSVIVTCLECKNVMRYPYRKEKSKINKRKKTNNK